MRSACEELSVISNLRERFLPTSLVEKPICSTRLASCGLLGILRLHDILRGSADFPPLLDCLTRGVYSLVVRLKISQSSDYFRCGGFWCAQEVTVVFFSALPIFGFKTALLLLAASQWYATDTKPKVPSPENSGLLNMPFFLT